MGKEQNTLAYTLKRCKEYNNDTFQMFAKGCNYCSKYGNGKIYSISGKIFSTIPTAAASFNPL